MSYDEIPFFYPRPLLDLVDLKQDWTQLVWITKQFIKSRNVVYGDHRDLHVNNLCRVEGEIRLWSPTMNCKFILTSSLNVLCHMLFVLLFIYGKRAVMLFKRRLYNLTRVFRPGMLAVLTEGFSGAARNQVIYTPFCP